jgi:hypothetical protein
MKTTKILYWVCTVLLLAMMLFSAVSTFMNNPQGVELAKHIGYPMYVFKFLAVAKILGIIAILTPGFPRVKEWAYAGFFFDLTGAIFSLIAVGEPASAWAPMFVFELLLFGSYIFYHKKLKTSQA